MLMLQSLEDTRVYKKRLKFVKLFAVFAGAKAPLQLLVQMFHSRP